MNIAHVRTRWAAIGAAVAITLGAGGIGITHATTSSGEKPIYKPITPCRMAAFGAAPYNVGPRTAPLAAGDILDLDGWGIQGECDLPPGTTGLALNVTAVDASTLTYLTFWPEGALQPVTANLNPAPGQPPTPNAVNVGLSAAGKFSVYNLAGTVGVFIDVVGVYDDHNHNDLYYTKAETYTKADVYTKVESDAALATKANATDAYSKSDILFATVAPGGASAAVVRGHGATGVTYVATGYYAVTFNRDITGCTWIATAGAEDDSGVSAAWATTRGRSVSSDVGVVIRDSAGSQTDIEGFHLAVLCP